MLRKKFLTGKRHGSKILYHSTKNKKEGVLWCVLYNGYEEWFASSRSAQARCYRIAVPVCLRWRVGALCCPIFCSGPGASGRGLEHAYFGQKRREEPERICVFWNNLEHVLRSWPRYTPPLYTSVYIYKYNPVVSQHAGKGINKIPLSGTRTAKNWG